jgi:uncharacterized cupin superfamily protein
MEELASAPTICRAPELSQGPLNPPFAWPSSEQTDDEVNRRGERIPTVRVHLVATGLGPGELEEHMVKPIMNLDDVEFDDIEENGLYTLRRGQISDHIGAKKLGYNLTVLPPGKAQCPFHCHHGEEEMFLIIEGEGELRFGDKRYPIRKHDVIACPPGGPNVAHQIINNGKTTMRYLALSTLVDVDTCEYPDSQKILIVTGQRGESGVRKMFRAENTVDYYDRERV